MRKIDTQEMLTIQTMLSDKEITCAKEIIKCLDGMTVSEAHAILDYLKLAVNTLGRITL